MLLNKHLFRYLSFVFVSAIVFASAIFLSPKTHAYSLSVTADSATLNVVSGKTSIKESSIEIISDCRAGYNFSLSTSNSPSLYLNGNDSGSAVFNAVDGTSTLASSNNLNKWGYYYNVNSHGTTNAPTENSIFSPLSTTPTVLKTTTDTASPSSDIDDTFSIYYGVNTADSVIPGSYAMSDGNNTNSTNGTINYYATMDSSCIGYIVNFNPNGGTGTMSNQTIPVGESTKLKGNEFEAPSIGSSYQDADGTTIPGTSDKLWTFWGWNTSADSTGDWYKDRESVTDLEQSGNNITLYAQWKQPTLADLTTSTPGQNKTIDHNTMQDMSPAACYNSDKFTAIGTPYGQATLTDNRDGTTRTYTVAKLPDNNCWMTQNLNLGASTAITLTSDDTDLEENTTFTLPASPTTYNSSSTGNYTPQVLHNKTITSYTVNGTTYSGVTSYYSWAAATATNTSVTTNGNVATSICAKNWDLPTNYQYYNLRTVGQVASYNNTNASYAGKNAGNEPYYFLYGGYRSGENSFTYETSYGNLWTSTSSSSNTAHREDVNSSGLQNASNYTRNKYYGQSIRCVASNGKATIHYDKNNPSATGTVTDQTNVEINFTNVRNNGYSLTNYQFKGWNTASNGSGTMISASGALSNLGLYDGQEITLYAQWDPVYYVAFNANESSVGGTAGSATGTMTNQTVIRDTATAIKTNTFALTGYIFIGWNTSTDGTGTFYSDGQKVTNLASTGSTITLYAVWSEGAYLDTGQNVNQKLKRLAGNSSATYTTQDTTITALVRSNTLPSGFTAADENTISTSNSPHPIYAWYDSTNTTIYYYSEATNIFMNKTSSYFFNNMRALSNLSTISTWDTIKVTNMQQMFLDTGYSATTFTLDLSSWNTSSVTNMNQMFSSAGYSATTFNLNLSSWDTSSVTDMSFMFDQAGRSTISFTLDLSDFDTSSVTAMNNMFDQAGYSATTFTLDLSSWDISSVTNMSRIFYTAGYNATTWSIAGLSSWDTSNVTNMGNMFTEAGYSATTFTLDLSSWDTSSVTDMSYMFDQAGYSATTWSVGDLSSWDTSSVKFMYRMFSSAGYSATTWSVGDLSSWDTPNVTNMSSMFSSTGYSATTWSVGDLSSWDTSSVTNMGNMFTEAGYSAASFTLNLFSWDTSSVTNMSSMFSAAGHDATTWSISGLSSWDTSSVTTMSQMFYNAGYSATTFNLDLSSWNTASVTNMSYMFYLAGYRATTFTLDLSSWNTSNVTNMSSTMFSAAGPSATTWSVTIPKTNDGTTTGPISNTTSNLYGNTTSVTATPPSGKSFTLAN